MDSYFLSDMHEAFFSYIRSKSTVPLTDEDIDLLKSIMVSKKLKKRQYLLTESEICRQGGFIVKGAMRQYSVDEKGDEHVIQLLLEHWWVGDRESFEKETPSPFFIDAWEESDLILFTKDKFDMMLRIPAAAEMTSNISTSHISALHKRVSDTMSLTAEERYENLMRTHPEFFQRFPQHLIASYLGITKETLSRIRHKAIKK
ncbi:MAG TPA: Crp/Fnr family transcriptional regulator [Chitinophagaceae bacterium]|nr:Crp/Fnr family transcriptional regulator [Chitinophagaceae bacterium]